MADGTLNSAAVGMYSSIHAKPEIIYMEEDR